MHRSLLRCALPGEPMLESYRSGVLRCLRCHLGAMRPDFPVGSAATEVAALASTATTPLTCSRRAFRQQGAAHPNTPDATEAAELEKDWQALKTYGMIGGFALLCVATLWYGSRQAKQRYFGAEGSARVSVETRGRPALGGPFVLVNTKGEPVSQAEFLGSWAFFYFGFTHCPEICPVELNRMSHVVDAVRAARPQERIAPLFVSCDPRRDSLEAIDEYLSVFHPDFIGLVGTPKQVNDACRSYRIYYSIPTDEDAAQEDYLIDHSIAIFLFDPQGRFVDFFGNRYDEREITEKVLHYMSEYAKDPTWTNW
ncbi:putative cytochrome c oxidase assembly factor [Leishmania major strain Friedlin]|uniref:Putative cytochrome c oxidase assembly factor n=1 Tax=Leishmania major TaxID=5664 RepID=O97196_LEIMA|nr:putative cytochrome c oxidase assembly factor [Leishmania major strain Friedlin]CAC22657.1 putative cytochrome c oxidase assembly factor [Leishmania major strain Friedlin]CAG9567841.1 cytochrome_c_oxidase_assembly_factor_-_putative [Leishmania major strain Friedlin]|eukprot:XP_888624.1 putative cytochrome c oxidase assembly factor [Leishmania major strain Friedlin]